jgi:formate hydrogenlyase subunit 3/multisubunit Na+/H+ antiporter MnhD subunit
MNEFLSKHKTTLLAIAMAILLFIGVPGLAWYIVSSMLSWITSQESDVAAAIIAAAATILAGIGAVIFSQQRTKTREIAESHRPKKVELYTKFVKKVMEVMQKSKEENSDDALIDDADLLKFFEEFTQGDCMLSHAANRTLSR